MLHTAVVVVRVLRYRILHVVEASVMSPHVAAVCCCAVMALDHSSLDVVWICLLLAGVNLQRRVHRVECRRYLLSAVLQLPAVCIRACLPLEKHLIVVLERVNVLIVQALYGKVQLVERRLLIKVVVLVPGAGQRRVVVDSVPGRLPVGVGDVTDCLPRLFGWFDFSFEVVVILKRGKRKGIAARHLKEPFCCCCVRYNYPNYITNLTNVYLLTLFK